MPKNPRPPRVVRQTSVPAASVLPPSPVARKPVAAAKPKEERASACSVPADPILDAAERVAMRDGVGHVTLDAVAKEAGLSKSGLIHHYPSKDALIGAMVLRKIDAWGNACEESFQRHAGQPGGAARGLINACFDCPDGEGGTDVDDEDSRRRGCVVIAALVHDAKHIDPVRKVHQRIDAKLAGDKLPPGVADAIHLALNGMWFNWVFNLSDLTPQRLERVREVLQHIVDHPQQFGAPAGAPVKNGRSSPAPATAGSRKRVSK
ncbi:MAG: TetR/AcrR family transcriptional regulator [Phycisphaerales bacterium]